MSDSQSADVATVFAAIDGRHGVSVQRDADGVVAGYRFEDFRGTQWMSGGWLEALLYVELLAEFRHRNDAVVSTNIYLADRAASETLAELDVAVLIRGQLHIIEAKTGEMTSGRSGASIDRAFAQADSLKHDLLGNSGKLLIVNPIVTNAPIVAQRARKGGEELFLGPDAVARAVARVVELATAG